MQPHGEVIVRTRTPDGLRESRRPFASLEELYRLCLSIREPDLIEGLLLHGADPDGQWRSLAFEFRSITSKQ